MMKLFLIIVMVNSIFKSVPKFSLFYESLRRASFLVCVTESIPLPKSPRLIPPPPAFRKSTCSLQLQNKLRKLLNTNSKENLFDTSSVSRKSVIQRRDISSTGSLLGADGLRETFVIKPDSKIEFDIRVELGSTMRK